MLNMPIFLQLLYNKCCNWNSSRKAIFWLLIGITIILHLHMILYAFTLSMSSPESLRRFSRVKSPITSPLSPQHMSITKNLLSSKALIWCSVNMGAARYFTSLSCRTSQENIHKIKEGFKSFHIVEIVSQFLPLSTSALVSMAVMWLYLYLMNVWYRLLKGYSG